VLAGGHDGSEKAWYYVGAAIRRGKALQLFDEGHWRAWEMRYVESTPSQRNVLTLLTARCRRSSGGASLTISRRLTAVSLAAKG
jgi:hypothetical protein